MQLTSESTVPIKLRVPREEAAPYIVVQLERGKDIRGRRIRTREDLDSARAEKLAWTKSTTEILRQIFSDGCIAEQYNHWVAAILPEYAELDMFIEQFYEEIDLRLQRLRAIGRMLETMPLQLPGEQTPTPLAIMNGSAPAAPQPDQPPQQAQSHTPAAARPQPARPMAPPAPVAPATAPAASAPTAPAPATPTPATPTPRRAATAPIGAFLLWGDNGAADPVRNFIRELGFQAEVQQDLFNVCIENNAPTGLELQQASFALLLLTPDQLAAFDESSGPIPPDCRKLLLQVGYFAGRCGRERVCILAPGPVSAVNELGINQISLDTAGGWQLQLARLLKRAGLEIDLNRLC